MGMYIANRHKMKMHSKSCPYVNPITKNMHVYDGTLEDAISEGYTLCKDCISGEEIDAAQKMVKESSHLRSEAKQNKDVPLISSVKEKDIKNERPMSLSEKIKERVNSGGDVLNQAPKHNINAEQIATTLPPSSLDRVDKTDDEFRSPADPDRLTNQEDDVTIGLYQEMDPNKRTPISENEENRQESDQSDVAQKVVVADEPIVMSLNQEQIKAKILEQPEELLPATGSPEKDDSNSMDSVISMGKDINPESLEVDSNYESNEMKPEWLTSEEQSLQDDEEEKLQPGPDTPVEQNEIANHNKSYDNEEIPALEPEQEVLKHEAAAVPEVEVPLQNIEEDNVSVPDPEQPKEAGDNIDSKISEGQDTISVAKKENDEVEEKPKQKRKSLFKKKNKKKRNEASPEIDILTEVDREVNDDGFYDPTVPEVEEEYTSSYKTIAAIVMISIAAVFIIIFLAIYFS